MFSSWIRPASLGVVFSRDISSTINFPSIFYHRFSCTQDRGGADYQLSWAEGEVHPG